MSEASNTSTGSSSNVPGKIGDGGENSDKTKSPPNAANKRDSIQDDGDDYVIVSKSG